MISTLGRLADRMLVRFVPHGTAAAACGGYWVDCPGCSPEGLRFRKRCYYACQGIPAYCESACQEYAARC